MKEIQIRRLNKYISIYIYISYIIDQNKKDEKYKSQNLSKLKSTSKTYLKIPGKKSGVYMYCTQNVIPRYQIRIESEM